jgi:hypothetical protein
MRAPTRLREYSVRCASSNAAEEVDRITRVKNVWERLDSVAIK